MSSDIITIRNARTGDLAAADALYAASYPALLKGHYKPSMLVLALPLISRAQPRLLASPSFFVAENGDGRLVGAGGWSRAAPADGRARRRLGHVRHLVTDHRLVRQGIGRRLLERVFETASGAGIEVLHCQSTLAAVPFYAALGFREIGPLDVPLAPGIAFPSVSMVRDL